MTTIRSTPKAPTTRDAGGAAEPTRAQLETELGRLKKLEKETDPKAEITYQDMMRASAEKTKLQERITVLEAKIEKLGAPVEVKAAEVQGASAAPLDQMEEPRPAFKSEKEMDVVCPVLGAMVASGRLKMDSEGNINLKQMADILVRDHGASPALAHATLAVGWGGNRPGDVLGNLLHSELNVLELRSGMIKHPADSAILTAGRFDEEKFQDLVSHAEPGGRMTIKSFGAAIRDQIERDSDTSTRVPTTGFFSNLLPDGLDSFLRGQPTAIVEFGALLNLYGKRDPATGERYIEASTLRDLYQHKKLPPNERMQSRPAVGVVDLTATMARLGWETTFGTASGTALEGAERALGKEVAGQDGMGGAGKATCPYMNAATQKSGPTSPAENDSLHRA